VALIEKNELKHIHELFNSCAPLFIALGDTVRQQLILDIADAYIADKDGINVKNLSAKSHLSRPAISHHLKVLKDSGIVAPYKVGTQIFYKLTFADKIDEVSALVTSIQNVIKEIRERELETGSSSTGNQERQTLQS
jgi:DNA-binding transcriptional ArsR family regulator